MTRNPDRSISTGARVLGGLLALAIAGAATAFAEPPKPVRKQIKQFLKSQGTLYARMDMPCKTGRHPFGTYKAPLVEVGPDGSNTDGELGMSFSGFHAQSTYWGIGPNDSLKFDEGEWDEGAFEVELYGVGPSDGTDTVIKFVNIEGMEDFEAAFDRAFATQPLQDEHPEWSDEMKRAVAERRLVNGMSKRQAYYVVGTPERVETSEMDGKKTEIWYTRQERGMQMGFWYSKAETTGYPSQLKFVDGELVDAGGSSALNLDD